MATSVSELLDSALQNPTSTVDLITEIYQVIPLRSRLWKLGSRTLIMGILNATPDSFSDGGKYIKLEDALLHVAKMINDGADIIDVGGVSTRPYAEEVQVSEELQRVIPLIQAIRKSFPEIPISIDTCSSKVAEEAIIAGADWINDISGGIRDPKILQVAKCHMKPLCLMHCRGKNSTEMMDLCHYESGKVLYQVEAELIGCVKLASLAGIRKWNLILDPGIGFSKDFGQNIEILQKLSRPHEHFKGFPLLIGVSNKSFIGEITGKNVDERTYGTSAAVAASICGGADIVRVHQVAEMADAIKVADAIWR